MGVELFSKVVLVVIRCFQVLQVVCYWFFAYTTVQLYILGALDLVLGLDLFHEAEVVWIRVEGGVFFVFFLYLLVKLA